MTALHRLCDEGRLYDVEEWVRAGQPLQANDGFTVKGRRVSSALEIALDAGNYALALLLLCNGYDPNLERHSPLDLALRTRRWDLFDLLLEWGADPQRVYLTDLFDTYRTEAFNRFFALGVDLTRDHYLAQALADHPGNKPLFGFAKRHREQDAKFQKELNIALVHHASDGNEKGVQLCLWAGADPHAPAPSLRYPDGADEDQSDVDPKDRFFGWTAIEEACRAGHTRILERLRPDPARDDFDKLYRAAANEWVIDILSQYALPKNAGDVIRFHVSLLEDRSFGRPRSVYTLERLFKVGARWQTSTPYETAHVRRALLRMSHHTFIDVMKLLAKDDHCAPTILQALGRTPTIRARMSKVGFIPTMANDARWFERPTRSREVLSKFGVALPTVQRRLPPCIEVGPSRRATHDVRLDRRTLFERVWSEPVEKLATSWGLSGRGLAKVCKRLQIPLPSRGFWATTRAGRRIRRPPLPELPDGEGEQIIIYLTGDPSDYPPND